VRISCFFNSVITMDVDKDANITLLESISQLVPGQGISIALVRVSYPSGESILLA
jgi:hypothetical protein